MKSVIHKPLGYICLCNTRLCLEIPAIKYHLVSNKAPGSGVKGFKPAFQLYRDIVGIQNCNLCCQCKSLRPHHHNKGMRYGKYMTAAEWGPGYSCCAMASSGFNQWMRRKKFSQFIINKNRSHTRATSPMRYCKCFMQVQMTYISTDMPGTGKSYLCIHICTIHINKSAVCMNDIGYFGYRSFEDTMC